MQFLHNRLQLAPAAAGFLLTASALFNASAQALEFEAGDVQGKLNTTVSIGAKYDLEGYVTPDDAEQLENDGERSFKRGFVSKTLKATSELELKKDSFGFFGRTTAYYDHVLMNGTNHWQANNDADVAKGFDDETGTFNGWSDAVKDNQGRGIKLQSAYVFADWAFDGGQKLSLKAGKQTHEWGETLFHGGGLRDLNAYDLALATLPGSDGDLHLAQGMVSADFKFNEQMALSGFVQYDWEKSILSGRGTYDSNKDIFVPGADLAHYQLSTFTLDAKTVQALGGDQDALLTALEVEKNADYVVVTDVSAVKSARKNGQWGVRFTLTPESLPDTEFAFYYANYHSSLPFIEGYVSSKAGAKGLALALNNSVLKSHLDGIEAVARNQASQAGMTADVSAQMGSDARNRAYIGLAGLHMLYNSAASRVVYPEDIKLWGASFNTTIWGYTKIAGELTYKENAPIWTNHPKDLIAKGTESIIDGNPTNKFNSSLANPNRMGAPDQWNANYVRKPVWDASLSVVQPFGAVLGTDLLYVVGEAAFQQVSGLKNYDRYIAVGSESWSREKPEENAEDRLDRFSWGYNLMLGAKWNDVLMSDLNLKSSVRFTHDVDGNSHRTGRFEAGEKKINMELTANYDDVTAKLTWGGDADDVLRNGTITGTVGYTF